MKHNKVNNVLTPVKSLQGGFPFSISIMVQPNNGTLILTLFDSLIHNRISNGIQDQCYKMLQPKTLILFNNHLSRLNNTKYSRKIEYSKLFHAL